MTTTKLSFGGSTSITCTLNNLASGIAQQSTLVDNTSDLFLDALVRVTVNVATVNNPKQVLVYAYGSEDGSTFPDTVTASDSIITLESPTVLQLAAIIPTPTSAKAYESDAFSIGRLYGGILPRKWGIVVSNTSGATLSSSGSSATYTGISLVTS